MDAVTSRDLDMVRILLKSKPAINTKNRGGETALAYTLITVGKSQIAKALIDAGADVNTASDGLTPLMWASRHRDTEVMAALVAKGAKVSVKGKNGWTCLIHAASSGSVSAVKFLLSKGADVKAKNDDGKTALDIAKELKLPAVMQALTHKRAK